MLTTVQAGPYTIVGLSVGGLYTSLQVKELGALFDVGIPARSLAGARHVFLSHGHADHSGALLGFLGLRGLLRLPPPRVFLPSELASDAENSLALMSRTQRKPLSIDTIPMQPGDEHELHPGLHVRAFRTHHTCASLGYQFFARVPKLREEHRGLSGREIVARKERGEDLFRTEERLELAYATDTLVRVLDTHPSLLRTRVLILECSFLDDRKTLEASRAGHHVHLDEILERAEQFENEALVLMHFSQMYAPAEVHRILQRRCPARLRDRLVAFAPTTGSWPG